MADKNASFLDMFKDFGKDLNLPGPQIDEIVEYHRKNIQALQDAAQASTAGAQALMAKQRAALEEALADITDMVQSANPTDPGKSMEKGTEFAKKSFETTIKNATEMSEIVRDSGAQSFEILKTRAEESIGELRKSFGGKK